MSAKKKTIILLLVGALIGVGICAYQMYLWNSGAITTEDVNQSDFVLQSVVMIPCCMLYAFGYAFGWKKCKGFVAKMAKVSADIAFFTILIHLITGKGIGKGLMIAMFVFCFAISVVWIPGVVIGIRQLVIEQKNVATV